MFTGIIEELGVVLSWEPAGDAARLTVRGPLVVSDARHGDSISVSGVCLTVVAQGNDWFTADVMAETIEMSTLKQPAPGQPVNLERAAQVGDRLGGHIVQGHIDGTSELLSITEGSAWRVLRFSLSPDVAALVAGKGSIAVDGVSLTVSAVGTDTVPTVPLGTGSIHTIGAAGTGSTDTSSTDPASISTIGAAGTAGMVRAFASIPDGTGTVTDPHSTYPVGPRSAWPHSVAADWFEVSLIPETLAATTLGSKKVGDLVNIETDVLARHVERMLQVSGRVRS